MELRELQAFRALMKIGSMTAAAQELGVTQPTISKLIAQLERRTKLRLFDRDHGRLHPRPESSLFLMQVERVFAALDEVNRNARQFARGEAGEVRIVAIPSIALDFLPRIAAGFLAERPDVRMALDVRGSSYIGEWVATRRVDFGFTSASLDVPGVRSERFFESRGICVLPDGHSLAAKPLIVPADLAKERFVALSRDTIFRQVIDRTFLEARIERRVVVDAGFSAIACRLVASGVGVTIVDPFSALDQLNVGGVVLRPFLPALKFELNLVFPSGIATSLAAQHFLQRLAEEQRAVEKRLRQVLAE